MQILGIDPSLTAFGWAVCDLGVTGKARCPEKGRFATSTAMEDVDRYIYMREQLRKVIQRLRTERNITRVAVESPAFGSSYSEGMYALFTFVREAFRLEKVDSLYLGISQVKQSARTLIKRPEGWTMEKPDMCEAANVDCGGRGKGKWNHNEADAYLIARLGGRFWQLYDGLLEEGDLSSVERDMFLKQHTYTRGKKAGQTHKKGLMFREGERFHLWSREDPDGRKEEGPAS